MLVTPDVMSTLWSEEQYASRFCGIAVRVPGSLTYFRFTIADAMSVVMAVTPSGSTRADSEAQCTNRRPL